MSCVRVEVVAFGDPCLEVFVVLVGRGDGREEFGCGGEEEFFVDGKGVLAESICRQRMNR